MADFSQLSALLAGMRTPQTPPAAPVTATTPFDKLQTLFAGGDITPMVRAIGGGMSSVQAGNDPFLAFGQGFGGSQNQMSTSAATAAQQAQEAQQKEYENALALNRQVIDQDTNQARMSQDQSQFDTRMSQDQSQFDERTRQGEQDRDIRAASEARQKKMDELQYKKTEAELKRMANSNGLTVNQMLDIERIAQAAGEGYVTPTERKTAIDTKREELLNQFQTGGGLNQNTQTNTAAPGVGDVVDGYVFQGGDPKSPESWKPE